MKIRALKYLTYHRNGVSGEPFYSATLTCYGEKGVFLATFTGKEDDKTIPSDSCRIVEMNDRTTNWRGDSFSGAINDWFADQFLKYKVNCIYDLTTNNQKIKTNSNLKNLTK